MQPRATILRPTPVACLYVLGVATTATAGFTVDSTLLIALAALASLPSSIMTIPLYYLAYGLLAQFPGVTPSSSAGAGGCTTNGVCSSSSTGELATWFAVTTDTFGVLSLVVAAAMNVVGFRLLLRLNRGRARPATSHL